MHKHTVALLLMGLTLAPSAARAGAVVLSPLLADDTVSDKQRLGVHQLLSSELDFSPEVSKVVELNEVPSGLNDWCLGNARCLGGIVRSNEGEEMLTGRMKGAGSNIVLQLVFYDGEQIAQAKSFTLPSDPTGMANAITPVIREMLTGVDPQQEAEAVATTEDFELLDEEIDEELQLDSIDAVANDIPTTRSVAATAPPPPAPRQPPPPAPAPSADDDLSAITFGGSVDDISVDEIDQIQFASADAEVTTARVESTGNDTAYVPTPQPVAQRRPIPEGMREAPTGQDAEQAGLVEVSRQQAREARKASKPAKADRPAKAPKPARTPRQRVARSNSSNTRQQRPEQPDAESFRVQIAARGGYSNYYSFDFVTGGLEGALRLAAGAHVVFGVETYSVNRILPPDVALEEGVANRWDILFPMNVGLIYQFDLGNVEPYVGADIIFAQYYQDAIGSDWAGGGRGRLGLNYMVIEQFGLNVNLAAGAWTGKNWSIIEPGVQTTGFLPQVSAGMVVRL